MHALEDVQISKSFPPNYQDMLRAFPECEKRKAIFAYDNVIYNPFDVYLTVDVIIHETIHFAQQKREYSVDDWYMKYLNDEAFRLEQEVEAYRAQYAFVAKRLKDRNELSWYLGTLAESLSSGLYGALVTRSEARALIAKA